MNTAQLENPWKVESIQDFSCLKCPECAFFTKEENDFKIHSVANHPLSATLFDEKMPISVIKGAEKEEVLGDVSDFNVCTINKEPKELYNSEDDPFDFRNSNIQQEGTNFMSSLTRYDSLVDDSSLNPVNPPKKMKMEPRYFYNADNCQIPKEQISKNKPIKRKRELDKEDPFTSNNENNQTQQRRQRIAGNKNLEEEKEEQIQPKQLTLMQFIFRQMWPDFS